MSNIIQVTNIAATVTEDNIKTLLGYVGPIREIIMYFEGSQLEETKVAYIVFESNSDAETSLHLHNTVFHDRALIILPLAESCKAQIPDINYAQLVRAPEKTVTGITPKSKNWPSDVLSMVVGRTGEQSIVTIEPNFIKQGLPDYPKLPYSTEVSKIDEIRRTVLITNLDSGTSPEQVLEFFQAVAEVKFIRMAGSEHDNAAYVEFSEQGAVTLAFGMMGTDFSGRAVMVQHSNVAINKLATNSRVDDAPRRMRGSHSRSRRHSRKKSKSREPSRPRRESKPKSHRRSRSRRTSKPRRSRSRPHKDRKEPRPSEHKKKSASKERKKARSRSRHGRPEKESRRSSRDRKEKNDSDRHRERKHKNDQSKDERRRRRSNSGSKINGRLDSGENHTTVR